MLQRGQFSMFSRLLEWGNPLFPTPPLDGRQLFFRHPVSSGEITLQHIQPYPQWGTLGVPEAYQR